MRAERRRTLALVPLVVAACVSQRAVAPRVLQAPSTTGVVEDVVRAALQADAAGDPAGDSLFAPAASVVANARTRFAAPRLAGVGYGGRVVVAASTTTMEGRFAWVTLDYRWLNANSDNAAIGRATVVCQLVEGRWRIVHLHSSQPLPWEP